MPTPVVIVTSGGRPVTNVTSGEPMTPVSSGGEPVTLVDNGEPVALVNDDLSEWATLTALAQILALEPVALWWPSEGSGWQGRTGGDLSAVGSPVGILPDLSELGGATLGEWLANPTTPELVTNGGFDTDTSGWTLGAAAQSTITFSAGEAIVENTGSEFGRGYVQVLGLTVGNVYTINGTLRRIAGSGEGYVATTNNAENVVIAQSGAVTSATNADASVSFVATEANGKIYLRVTRAGTQVVFDNISVRELPGIHAIAPTDAARPLLAADPTRLTWDKVDDVLNATMPATTGKMVLSTPEGTAVYGVNISAGSYDVGGRGGDFFPGTSLVGQTIGTFTDEEAASIATIFRAAGGGDDYGAVTDFTRFWQGWSEITSFPEIDTSSGTNFYLAWYNCSSLTTFPLLNVSSGTNFQSAWRNCPSLTTFPLLDVSSGTNFREAWLNCSGLTTFPLLDVSSGTNFQSAWQNCTSLTTFPANMFDTVTATNFANAFLGTNLSQTSIDNILTSINTAGTSSGTFLQSGGSAPSATGEAAIDALRGRGWTVTVTGGY